MIYYPLETLIKSGIEDILIVTSGPHVGHFLGILKNGKDFGIRHLEYAYQEKPDGGIADALSLAEDFADSESVAVILGDNTTDADISKDVKNFKDGALLFLKQVEDPYRFGIVEFQKNDDTKILRILEKPKNPPSNFAVTGLYLYDNSVFSHIKNVRPSTRGELEITDVNNLYLKNNKLKWTLLDGFWTDAGTFDALHKASYFWSKKNAE